MRVPSLPMMGLEPDDRRRIGRAIWAYSELDQKELAARAGLKYDRLRAALNDNAKPAPTSDELLAIANVAKVPASVVVYGFSDNDERLADAEVRITELLTAVGELTNDSARHTREIQALRAAGRQRQPVAGDR